MADCLTFEELFRVARDEALSRNSRLRREVIERPGTDANALTAASVAVADVVIGRMVLFQASLFIDTAKGIALDKLLWDRYKLLRKQAAPALTEVVITSDSPVVNGFSIPKDTQFFTADGRVFTSTAARTFLTGTSGPVPVPVQSSLTGLSQQVRAGTITSMRLTTAPGGLTITNPLASAGAADEEKDDAFRERGRKFYTTAYRGTLAAIQRRALDAPGVRTAAAFETVEEDATPARLVEVVITDQFTEELANANVIPAGYETQADTLSLTVRSLLSDTRAAGIQVIVTMAQVRLMGITLLLRYRPNVDVEATTAAARARAVAYTNGLASGETWDPAELEMLLTTVPGLIVLGGEVVSPSLPQPAGQLQVWRTAPSNVVIGNV